MAGFKPKQLLRGCQKLLSPQNTTCTDADTYYKIEGTWGGAKCVGFERDGLGKLTCLTNSDTTYLFNGTSDVLVDKVAKITYALFVNGQLVEGAETPHDFTAASKTEGIAITGYPIFNTGDYIEVYVKSSAAGTVVTSESLIITFLGTKIY